TVARYFREQEGLDVTRGLGATEAKRRLAEVAARAAKGDPLMRQPVGARDPLERVLRAFCRARAIPLPLRHDASGDAKSAGLAAAIRLAVEDARETRTVIVVSDLDPIGDVARVKSALGAARHRRHRVTFVAPAGEDFLRGTTAAASAGDE